MNNKLNILTLAFLTLTTFSVYSNDTIHISINIETPNESTVIDECVRQELFDHAKQSLYAICESASDEFRFNFKKTKSDLEVESDVIAINNAEEITALHNYLVARLLTFIDICNKHAIEENRNVSFNLVNQADDIALTIVCGEVEPQPTYWQSVKHTVSVAADKVTTKATEAGVFIKDVTVAGAEKVSNAAFVVKEKTKHGIHTAAEKISEITE